MNPISIASLAPRDYRFRMSDELIAALKQRVASNYYGRPEVIEIIARAILELTGCGTRGAGCRVPLHPVSEI